MQDRHLAFQFEDLPADDPIGPRRARPKLQLVSPAAPRNRLPARRRFSLRIDDGGFRPYRSFWT